jgi:hypothetical protein
MGALDPNVAGDATLLGVGQFSHAEGRSVIADRLLALFGPMTGRTIVPMPIDAAPGAIVLEHSRVRAVMSFEIEGGVITLVRAFVRRTLPYAAPPD